MFYLLRQSIHAFSLQVGGFSGFVEMENWHAAIAWRGGGSTQLERTGLQNALIAVID